MENQEKDRYKRAFNLSVKNYLLTARFFWKATSIGLLVPAVGSILIFFIPPLIVARIIDLTTSQSSQNFESLLPYIALFGATWLLGEVFWRIGLHFIIKAEALSVERLYTQGLSSLLRHDVSFFINNFSGSLTKKTSGYAVRFIDVTDAMLFNVFPSLIPALFGIVILSFYSPYLGLMLLAWVSLTIAIVMPFIKKRKELVDTREKSSNILTGHVADVYTNIEAVKSHANEKLELATNKNHVLDWTKKMRRSWDYQNQVIDMIISPLYILSNLSGLALSIYLAVNNQIPYSAIIVVFAYYGFITRFMWEFNGIYRRLETAFSDASQFTELLLDEPEINDPIRPEENSEKDGKISFKNVKFSYEEEQDTLFDNFNLEIKSGEKIGLIGRSGGGKTSITKLLLRFVDIDSGSVEIDGIKLKNMTQEHLRSLIAYVPQDPVMFHRSIADNIAYGRQSATREEIIDAARKAHAHGFIEELPKGYETLVGERGLKLSGGQRQRVAIARAILRNSPILLLDEATSALDSESEGLIQDALKKLMKDRTTIVIAHRLSTIQNMDRIIVLEKGQIIEEGTHKELINNSGTYAKLWEHQSGGFLED